jgi:RNA polymerase sigma factor (sigma-70 family)
MTALEGQALLDHGKTIARRYARRIGPDTAEELKAEAIVRALASPPPDGRIEPWLERIYRNLFVDLWRRGSVRLTEAADLDGLPSEGTPEDEVLRHERRRMVRAGLRSLPRESRRALLSKYYREEREDQAVARFGVAPVTVRTRIHRALQRLRVQLGQIAGFCPTLLGRLGVQLVTVGVAPVMVAALLVVANVQTEPAAQRALPGIAAVAPTPIRSVAAASPRDEGPAPDLRAQSPAKPARASTRPSVVPVAAVLPEPTAPAEESSPVVANVLAPEGLVVAADPDPPAAPCMVEAPASFAVQIEKMIEDTL